MSNEDNKAIARRAFAVADQFARGEDIKAEVEELLAPSARHHPSGAPVLDNAAFLQSLQPIAKGFPGCHHTIEDQIAEGDKVATRVTWHGTHTGTFRGIPSTGKQVTMSGIDIVRIVGDQIVEHWSAFDALGLIQQLGAVPAPGQTS